MGIAIGKELACNGTSNHQLEVIRLIIQEQLKNTIAVTRGRLPLPGGVCRYPGTFAVTRGRLPLPGDLCRYPGTFAVTGIDL